VGGWDVGVVAANGGADVAVAGDEPVGGVEADPAELGEECLDPGVGGRVGGAVVVRLAVVEVAADVAAGDAELRPDQGDHDVGEVLADAHATGERDVDGGVDLGGLWDVVEEVVDLLVELLEDEQGIVAAADVELVGEEVERGRGGGELGGEEHLGVVAVGDHVVQLDPGVGGEEGGNLVARLDLDEGFGDDDELAVLAGDVEVMDMVGEVIAIAEDAAARADGEVKGEAALVLVRARVHARLHHAFADGVAVEELREVADGVIHGPFFLD